MNGEDSQSGFHVFSELTKASAIEQIPAERRFVTGSHRASVAAVANGEAQLAAIDAISFAMAKRYDPEITSQVSIIGHSIPKPGLPLITSKAQSENLPLLFGAVEKALSRLDKDTREALMIQSIVPANDTDYTVFLSSQSE